ncbi:unnamed protein product [Tilletia controversa]|nr:unnamed protein product [Tilletia controversa]
MVDIVLPLSQHYPVHVESFRSAIDLAKLDSISPARSEWIQALVDALQAAFNDCARSSEVAMRWRNLIQQLAAEEGVLQLCRPLSVPLLRSLGSDTVTLASTTFSQQATSLARHCPAIGLLLLAYQDQFAHPSLAIVKIRFLLVKTAALVVHQLLVLGVVESNAVETRRPSNPAVTVDADQAEEVPFFQSGVLYGAKPVRERKWYSKIEDKGGIHVDDSIQQDNEAMGSDHCRKYFTAYVTAKRTGGLMALWCRHLICVGLHAIPKAEGRNDVFSAIYRFWPVAPEVIVYDFACQLAPYSLHREPEFFQNTLFVVDQMHQHGHTKFSTSSFLSTYMGVNQDLHRLNSSAAESGNAGLARIKKSVSYCSQEHALALVEHFLSIWNRKRALEMGNILVS